MDLETVDLGRLAYAPALERQRRRNLAVSLGRAGPAVMLVEHDPVITVSHRKEARGHLLATPQRLAELGIDRQDTDRGGDITYHGPGQLVCYALLDLKRRGLNVRSLVEMLENAVTDTLAGYGIDAYPRRDAHGAVQ